jgi:uncharacterized protein
VIRAVIDTNVLVSAMIAPSGNEALLVLAARQGFIRPCFSEEICDEYSGVLGRPKFGFSSDEIAALLNLLRENREMISPSTVLEGSPDPGDDKFIAYALAAKADYLVTGNKRDFPEDRIAPAMLVNAGELLNIITLEQIGVAATKRRKLGNIAGAAMRQVTALQKAAAYCGSFSPAYEYGSRNISGQRACRARQLTSVHDPKAGRGSRSLRSPGAF